MLSPPKTIPHRLRSLGAVALAQLLRHAAFCALISTGALAQAEDPLLATIPVGTQVAALQPSTAQESRVKAAYLVKFTQYTNWPATAFESDTSPIVIGVVGTSLIATDLEQEARPITSPRRVEIRTVSTPEEAARCHVVFLSRVDSRIEENWLQALKEKSILTVGETDHAIKHGAIIRLATEGKKIRFDVSRPAMDRASLKISSDMLRYARTVHNTSEEPN